MTRLTGKKQIVLITGASSGIGKAIAELFTREGFHVFGTSRQEQPNENGIEMVKLDVRSDDSVKRCVAKVLEQAGRIDILINNAGVEYIGIAEETPLDDTLQVFETNFFGVIRMINAVLPGMRANKHGRIINIGSLAAWVGEPGEAFYSASKHALAGYTEALCHELWPLGIKVILVEPGAFKTNVIDAATVAKSTISDYDTVREAALQTLKKSIGKGNDPHKMAKLILKIAITHSPKMRYAAGSEALLIPYLKVLLPQRFFVYLLRRGFGLSKRK